jgi:pimeloyl-ACP methyl ester carboxylesterase
VAAPHRIRTVALGERRTMTLDDVGDPGGVPVLFLHGTPDSRLARHPDDGLATAAGVRLLAVDRPGYGGSSPSTDRWTPAWPAAVATDVARLLDDLGVERCSVLAWSGGALTALALAATPATADRVATLGIVAGLVPVGAFADPMVRAAGIGRLAVQELAATTPPGVLGDEVAPLIAPFPCDLDLAIEHRAEQRTAADAAELAGVDGGVERMAAALVEGVRGGLAGVAADVEAQARPLDVDLSAIACPVHLWYGTADAVTPPAFGRWYAAHIPDASLSVVEGAAHYLALTHWTALLSTLADVGGQFGSTRL